MATWASLPGAGAVATAVGTTGAAVALGTAVGLGAVWQLAASRPAAVTPATCNNPRREKPGWALDSGDVSGIRGSLNAQSTAPAGSAVLSGRLTSPDICHQNNSAYFRQISPISVFGDGVNAKRAGWRVARRPARLLVTLGLRSCRRRRRVSRLGGIRGRFGVGRRLRAGGRIGDRRCLGGCGRVGGAGGCAGGGGLNFLRVDDDALRGERPAGHVAASDDGHQRADP